MFGTYSYHQIIRKTVIAFGTVFNDIYIEHRDSNDEEYSTIKVPISYGPIQKFLARIEQKPDLRERVALTLPRMSFEVGQLSYDASRKSSTLQSFKALTQNNNPVNVFMPVPYNLPIELSIACKYNDDMFQIIEQILPYFRPEFNLTVDLVSTIGEKKDIPLILQSVSPFQDNYEGNFQERRSITCTLNFVAKIFFYGPIPSDGNGNIIKKVKVDYYSGTDIINSPRKSSYVVTPRAIKDYTDDATTTLVTDINEKITEFEVSDAIGLSEKSYIMINNEEMYIQSISENKLKVLRGQDNTNPSPHYTGDTVDIINQADDDLVKPIDDFGFDAEKFDW